MSFNVKQYMASNQPPNSSQVQNTNQKKYLSSYPQKTRKERKDDLDRALRGYVQSYIYWLYVQNENFSESLSSVELSNYFFKKLTHPLWFRVYFKFKPFFTMVYVDSCIKKYMYNADVLEHMYLFRIRPIDKANYREVPLAYYSPSITYKQAEMVTSKCKQKGVSVHPQEIASMTNQDVDYLLAALIFASPAKKTNKVNSSNTAKSAASRK